MSHFIQRIAGRAQMTYRHFLRLTSPRQTHLYCVGTAKSGTHSIAAIFSQRLATAHEVEAHALIDMILADPADRARIRRHLRDRHRRLKLEIDSSQLNYFVLDELIELFPRARFLLTIRNPYHWLDSFMNHQLGRGASDHWKALRDFRFARTAYEHPREEKALKEQGLYTLDGYLSYWAEHNHTVLRQVPNERLLVVRTDEIDTRARDIASFAGVPDSYINTDYSHSFKAVVKLGVLEAIDRSYLDSKIDQHCADLVNRFFPELRERG
jgi:hypothetical protein